MLINIYVLASHTLLQILLYKISHVELQLWKLQTIMFFYKLVKISESSILQKSSLHS